MNINQDPYELFQKQLVQFANTSFGRRYLGFGRDIPESKKIVQVTRNGLHFYDPKTDIITAKLRIGNDVDKKVKHALEVGTIAATALASLFGRPEFALGMILATKTLNTGNGDGWSQAVATSSGNGDSNWNQVHDFATANFSTTHTNTTQLYVATDYTDRFYIARGFLPVFLSIQRSAKVKGNPTMRLTAHGKANNDNDGFDWINLVGPTTQASPTSLTSADYNQCGAVNNPQELATRRDLGGLTGSGNNTWTLNSTGINLIEDNLQDYLKLGIRLGHDCLDHKFNGTFNNGNKIDLRPSEYSVASQRPLLTVQYTSSSAFIGLI